MRRHTYITLHRYARGYQYYRHPSLLECRMTAHPDSDGLQFAFLCQPPRNGDNDQYFQNDDEERPLGVAKQPILIIHDAADWF